MAPILHCRVGKSVQLVHFTPKQLSSGEAGGYAEEMADALSKAEIDLDELKELVSLPKYDGDKHQKYMEALGKIVEAIHANIEKKCECLRMVAREMEDELVNVLPKAGVRDADADVINSLTNQVMDRIRQFEDFFNDEAEKHSHITFRDEGDVRHQTDFLKSLGRGALHREFASIMVAFEVWVEAVKEAKAGTSGARDLAAYLRGTMPRALNSKDRKGRTLSDFHYGRELRLSPGGFLSAIAGSTTGLRQWSLLQRCLFFLANVVGIGLTRQYFTATSLAYYIQNAFDMIGTFVAVAQNTAAWSMRHMYGITFEGASSTIALVVFQFFAVLGLPLLMFVLLAFVADRTSCLIMTGLKYTPFGIAHSLQSSAEQKMPKVQVDRATADAERTQGVLNQFAERIKQAKMKVLRAKLMLKVIQTIEEGGMTLADFVAGDNLPPGVPSTFTIEDDEGGTLYIDETEARTMMQARPSKPGPPTDPFDDKLVAYQPLNQSVVRQELMTLGLPLAAFTNHHTVSVFREHFETELQDAGRVLQTYLTPVHEAMQLEMGESWRITNFARKFTHRVTSALWDRGLTGLLFLAFGKPVFGLMQAIIQFINHVLGAGVGLAGNAVTAAGLLEKACSDLKQTLVFFGKVISYVFSLAWRYALDAWRFAFGTPTPADGEPKPADEELETPWRHFPGLSDVIPPFEEFYNNAVKPKEETVTELRRLNKAFVEAEKTHDTLEITGPSLNLPDFNSLIPSLASLSSSVLATRARDKAESALLLAESSALSHMGLTNASTGFATEFYDALDSACPDRLREFFAENQDLAAGVTFRHGNATFVGETFERTAMSGVLTPSQVPYAYANALMSAVGVGMCALWVSALQSARSKGALQARRVQELNYILGGEVMRNLQQHAFKRSVQRRKKDHLMSPIVVDTDFNRRSASLIEGAVTLGVAVRASHPTPVPVDRQWVSDESSGESSDESSEESSDESNDESSEESGVAVEKSEPPEDAAEGYEVSDRATYEGNDGSKVVKVEVVVLRSNNVKTVMRPVVIGDRKPYDLVPRAWLTKITKTKKNRRGKKRVHDVLSDGNQTWKLSPRAYDDDAIVTKEVWDALKAQNVKIVSYGSMVLKSCTWAEVQIVKNGDIVLIEQDKLKPQHEVGFIYAHSYTGPAGDPEKGPFMIVIEPDKNGGCKATTEIRTRGNKKAMIEGLRKNTGTLFKRITGDCEFNFAFGHEIPKIRPE